MDEFVDEGGAQRPQLYRSFRGQIDMAFVNLETRLRNDSEASSILETAELDWAAADKIATEILSVERAPGDPETAEMMERFHGKITASSDRLGTVYELLEGTIEADHQMAIAAYDRLGWYALVAGIVSFLCAALGIFLFGRVISHSVDRLVHGAERFAKGDRDHRIDVQVPPELRNVADEFNSMIERIEEYETALSDLAMHDGLTGLLNRRALDEALYQMHERIKRIGEQGALLVLDIDHFKSVNDTHGHTAGDEVLRSVAALMKSELRQNEEIYRAGGEEFAVLLPGIQFDEAIKIATRLRQAVAARPVKTDNTNIPVTISVGAAKAIEALRSDQLVETADAALYQAKAGGRNRVVAVDETGMREIFADYEEPVILSKAAG